LRKKANLEDVIKLYIAVIRLPDLIRTFESVMDEAYKDALDAEYTKKIRSYAGSFAKLQEIVETTIDLEAMDNNEYKIK
jgi:DNA mismatch repair protein MSH2